MKTRIDWVAFEGLKDIERLKSLASDSNHRVIVVDDRNHKARHLLVLQHLPWDSAMLDRNAYRLEIHFSELPKIARPTLSLISLKKELLQAKSDLNIQFASCRVSSQCIMAIQSLEAAGFYLTDNLITFKKSIEMVDVNSISDQSMVDIQSWNGDMSQVKTFAEIFSGDRFDNDPNITEAQYRDLYREWIYNSCVKGYADKCFVYLSEHNEISGFISCKRNTRENIGVIDLLGVHPAKQGKGVGSALVRQAFRYFSSEGMSEVKVGTQAGNLGAIRLYQRHRFLVDSVDVGLHLWYDK